MTDPYAETDEWPTTPAAPEPSGSTPEAGEDARVARYAEVICAHHCGAPHPSVKALVAVHGREARAAMAVADQETADLRAEVTGLQADLVKFAGFGNPVARAESAEAESARLASVVAKVEALRDRWLAVNVPSAEVTSWSHYAGDALRAALASVAPEPTPNTGERPKRHHHSRKAMECTHVANDCCVDCCEPGGAFEPPAASSVDDKEGEAHPRCACTQYRPAATPTAEAGE